MGLSVCSLSTLWVAILISSCAFNKYPQGEALYNRYCASCHMDNGGGLMALYPPLAGSDYFLQHRDEFACIVRYGLQDTISVNGVEFNTGMEGIKDLNEVEMANIYNYIATNWYSDIDPISDDEIKQDLKECEIK